jgi:GcrA cell cycle regulator
MREGDSAESLPHGKSDEEQPMSWTDERVELLKKLWAEGLSASQIAAELGGVTRNAVIGKVHRLGLASRAKSTSAGIPRPRKPRTHMLRVARPMSRGANALALAYELEPEPELGMIDNVIPLGQRRTLLELTDKTCRWPIGDPATPEFFFCGGNPLIGLPYCHYHARIAYQPPAERRKDRRPAKP